MLYLKNDPLHTQPCVGGKGLFEKPNTKIVTLLLVLVCNFQAGLAGTLIQRKGEESGPPGRT